MSTETNAVREFDLNEITVSDVSLRSVNKDDPDFRNLVNSVRKEGVVQPISVREEVDPDTKETQYVLVDGLQRYTASREAGRDTILARIVDADSAKALALQFMTNMHAIKTKPAEYSRQLHRILETDPNLNADRLADMLSVSIEFIKNRLSLGNLIAEAQKEVDNGKIALVNAYALAKLPPEEQANYVEQAKNQPTNEFVPTTQKRVKDIKSEQRKGKKSEEDTFTPTIYMRKMSELKNELETREARQTLVTKGMKPTDAFDLAINWVLHQDPASIEEQKRKWEERQAKKKEAAERRKAAKEAKQQAAEV